MQEIRKRILILPALFDHIDLIKEAIKNGYDVVTCDNNLENEGHVFANFSENISLLDLQGVLEFSIRNNISAISTFSTDIGAIPAAYVAEKLKLRGNRLSTIEIMANKYLFRQCMDKYGFHTPYYQCVSSFKEIEYERIQFPLIVKPTDRAGSKGVAIVSNIVQLENQIPHSLEYSFEKKVIIEEYIESAYPQIHGDALVQNGQVIFCCLGDQYFGEGNRKFAPIATSFPCTIPEKKCKFLLSELKRFIDLVGYCDGGINIEARLSINGNIYFIELGPRYGGNFIPKTISYVYDINIFKYIFKVSIGDIIQFPDFNPKKGIFQFILRSKKSGIFKSLDVNTKDDFEILESYLIAKKNSPVYSDNGPSNIINIFILKVRQIADVSLIISRHEEYFKLDIRSFNDTLIPKVK